MTNTSQIWWEYPCSEGGGCSSSVSPQLLPLSPSGHFSHHKVELTQGPSRAGTRAYLSLVSVSTWDSWLALVDPQSVWPLCLSSSLWYSSAPSKTHSLTRLRIPMSPSPSLSKIVDSASPCVHFTWWKLKTGINRGERELAWGKCLCLI